MNMMHRLKSPNSEKCKNGTKAYPLKAFLQLDQMLLLFIIAQQPHNHHL